MSPSVAGACGDYCGKCPNFRRTCDGCIPSDHLDCAFIACCGSRKIPHCGLCSEFPCAKLNSFVPDDRPGCTPGYHVEGLRRRKEIGDDAWVKEQSAKWKDML